MRNRYIESVLGAVLVPFIIVTVYLYASRWPERVWTEGSDTAAWVVSVALGIMFVVRLPVRLWVCAVLAALYVPVISVLLFVYAANLVCAAFGDCM